MKTGTERESAGSAQRMGNSVGLGSGVAFGSQILGQGLRRFGALATRFVDCGFRHAGINDSGFDEPASFECVHADEPLMANTERIVGIAAEQKAPPDFSDGAFTI